MLQDCCKYDGNESNCLKKGTNVHLFSEILFNLVFYFINWCNGHGHANLTDCNIGTEKIVDVQAETSNLVHLKTGKTKISSLIQS